MNAQQKASPLEGMLPEETSNNPMVKELKKSFINDSIIALNFQEINENVDLAFSNLLYGLGQEERTNTGKLRESWLKKYDHLYDGGWWCSGVDLLTLKDSEWGCFKPYKPRISNGKPIKYEHPVKVPTGIFALKISDEQFKTIAQQYSYPQTDNFWDWVINYPVPVIITEGAKKAACLLSQGLVAIALPGIWNGYRSSEQRIIPELQTLSKTPREFIFAFDQDSKWSTQNNVFRAVKKTAEALLLENDHNSISVMDWDTEEGKGIDDLVAYKGVERLAEVYESRLSLEQYIDEKGAVKKLDRPKLLEFMVRNFSKRLAYNELSGRIEFDGNSIELSDALQYWLIEEFRVQTSEAALFGAFQYVAKKNSYHPVVKYLEKCAQVDPISIDDLATRYLGTKDPIYNVYFKKWLISAVARALEPGCKVDTALILQSDQQGIGKSTLFKILGGEFFDDSFGGSLESTKSLMVLHKSWIQEWSEFDHVTSKQEFNIIKSFLTRTSDCFVAPYGRDALDHPRRCVLAGSVNKAEFLRDETGDRRFMVIPIPKGHYIPTDQLAKERDAIWSSAIKEYLKGRKHGYNAWVLTREEEGMIKETNKAFRVTDEWEVQIEEYLEAKARKVVSVTEIMEKVFNIEASKHDRATQMRIAAIMVKLGWRKEGNKKGIDEMGNRRYLWIKDTPENHQEITETEKNDQPQEDSQGLVEVSQRLVTKVSQDGNSYSVSLSENADQPDQPFEQTFQKILETEKEIHFNDVILAIDHEMSRLGWSVEDGKDFLLSNYGKKSRHLLSDRELIDFYKRLAKEDKHNGKA